MCHGKREPVLEPRRGQKSLRRTRSRDWVRFRGARDGTVYLAAPSPFIRAKLIEREQAIRAAWGVEHVDIAVVASDGQG